MYCTLNKETFSRDFYPHFFATTHLCSIVPDSVVLTLNLHNTTWNIFKTLTFFTQNGKKISWNFLFYVKKKSGQISWCSWHGRAQLRSQTFQTFRMNILANIVVNTWIKGFQLDYTHKQNKNSCKKSCDTVPLTRCISLKILHSCNKK